MTNHSAANIEFNVDRLRKYFYSGTTRSLEWRKEQLRRLMEMFKAGQDEFAAALAEDLGKPALETKFSETGYVLAEIKHALKNLSKWAKPRHLHTPVILKPGKARIMMEPYGLALVMGPWNYPVQLAVTPLVAAIAAGNCVILKPSEIAPAVSRLLASSIPEYLDNEAVAVIEGDVEVARHLLDMKFDYIFYTGSSIIGRKVMAAAAANLTPVTLELGGKCPCLVDKSADLKVAARRIVWGKFMNAGQTCVAPDYLLVDEQIEMELIDKICAVLRDFYGQDPQKSPAYGRIINCGHIDRLSKLLDGGTVVTGGFFDLEDRYFSPTIMRGVDSDSEIMQAEIFGPILPVLSVSGIAKAIQFVKTRPKPLALYLFSSDKKVHRQVLHSTSSGGVCINDTILQLSTPHFPFGGVGESGMGRYHGRAGFDTFSNPKTVLRRGTWLDPALRYP